MVQIPMPYDRNRAGLLPPSLQLLLSEPTQLLSAPVRGLVQDEFAALNALIYELGARWSKEARDIKFDFEFRAVEQERSRVAKELHDEILPNLARLIRFVQSQTDKSIGETLVDELHATVSAFRDLLGELHPVDLEELGLTAALSNICKRYARMTQRFVVFVEDSETCNLSSLQQLCAYRAVQSVLRMFAESQNDILLLKHDYADSTNIISIRCIDKSVLDADWLSSEKPEFIVFDSWCAMAGATVDCGVSRQFNEFPCDLIIRIAETPQEREEVRQALGQFTQARLHELNSILAHAKEEWTNLILKDRPLFESLAIETERQRISAEINRLIIPHLDNISHIVTLSANQTLIHDVSEKMKAIANSVAGVMSELHPRLLAQAGLVPSIKTLVDRFRRASLIETTLDSDAFCDHLDISLDAKFAIYRVTQEALNNVEKHSGASHAHVSVKHADDELIICIEDNGKGLQVPKSTLSRGLKIIKERANGIGAKVTWQKAPHFESGTLVKISLANSGGQG